MIKNPTYVGKIRWREVLYDGNHDAIVSEVLFDKAQALLKDRVESLSGRRFDSGDERLLSGIIKCARCKGHMVGVTTHKKERRYPYYLCNKRWNTHDCDQDYVRADLIESAIIQDVKTMYRDEQFIARIWEEANKLVGKEKPALEKEIARIEDQAAKIQASIDRYFDAFESGAMKPDLCNQKVQDLKAQLQELEVEKRELDVRRERLELPSIDREMLSRLVDEFEETIEKGTNQKKRLFVEMSG